jgi:hypothetical protein
MISILVPDPKLKSLMRQLIFKGNLFRDFFVSLCIPGAGDFLHKKDLNGRFLFFSMPGLGLAIRYYDYKEPLMEEKHETLMSWALKGWERDCNTAFSAGDKVAVIPNLGEFNNLSSGDEDDDRWILTKTILRQRFSHEGRIEKFDADGKNVTVKMNNGSFVFPIESLKKI